MMGEYRYLAKMRPPGPGAVPRDGLVEANCNERWTGGRHYWGTVSYSRKLSREEIDAYELEYIGEERT